MLLVVFVLSVRWFGLPGEFGEQLADARLRGPLGEAEWWGSSFASAVASCSLGALLCGVFLTAMGLCTVVRSSPNY